MFLQAGKPNVRPRTYRVTLCHSLFVGNGSVNSFDRVLQLDEYFERFFCVTALVIRGQCLGHPAALRNGFSASANKRLHVLILLIHGFLRFLYLMMLAECTQWLSALPSRNRSLFG